MQDQPRRHVTPAGGRLKLRLDPEQSWCAADDPVTLVAWRADLARAIAYREDAPVRVIGPDNRLVGGDTTIMEAVTGGLPFMVRVDVDVLAIDCDSEHLRREMDRIASILRRAGERPVLAASGRPSRSHFLARVRDGALHEQLRQQAKTADLDVRDWIRPPLAPHRLGLPVGLISPTDPTLPSHARGSRAW